MQMLVREDVEVDLDDEVAENARGAESHHFFPRRLDTLSGTKVSVEEIDKLLGPVREISGCIVLNQGSPGYTESCAIFNVAVQHWPPASIVCRSVEAAVSAVQRLIASGVPFTIKAGGHGIRGSACRPDAVLLDVSQLRKVQLDRKTGLVTAEPGALWSDVDGFLRSANVAVPGGTVSHTGIAGLTLAGGLGWLSTVHGLSCDSLTSAVVVDGRGEIRTVTVKDDLWAFRGAGRHLGFVASFEFQSHPLGADAVGFRVKVPDDAMEQVLEGCSNDCLLTDLQMSISPAFMFDQYGEPAMFLDGLASDAAGLASWLASVDLSRATVEWTGSYFELQRRFDNSHRFGRRNYWKTGAYHAISPSAAGTFVELLHGAPSPLSMITLDVLAGAAQTEPEGGSVVPFRDARFILLSNAIWTSPDDDSAGRAWAQRVLAAAGPPTAPAYANYDMDDTSLAPDALTARRLAVVKDDWDPHGRYPAIPASVLAI